MTPHRYLLLVRHAKAVPDDYHQDFTRSLNDRGKDDAVALGKYLHNIGFSPDAWTISPAKRTRSTSKRLAKELEVTLKDHQFIPEMYGASVQVLMDCIKRTDDDFSRLCLVGHNPGMNMLADFLLPFPVGHFPTCGAALIRFDEPSWSLITPHQGKLVWLRFPERE